MKQPVNQPRRLAVGGLYRPSIYRASVRVFVPKSKAMKWKNEMK